MKPKEKVAHLYIKMTEEERQKLKRIAKIENRSMKGQVLHWVKQYENGGKAI